LHPRSSESVSAISSAFFFLVVSFHSNCLRRNSKTDLAAAAEEALVIEPAPRKVERKPSTNALATLRNDAKLIRDNPLPLIAACPLDKNLYEWHANIVGPEGSPYENGIFHFKLVFPTEYPAAPPSAIMLSHLPHPHVQKDRICLDLLSDFQNYFDKNGNRTGWSSAYNVQAILLQMQAFLMTLEDDEEDGVKVEFYLNQIPAAIQASRRYSCPDCSHKPGNPYPPIPTLEQTDVLGISVGDENPLKTSFTQKTEEEAIKESLYCHHTRVTFAEDVLGFGIRVVSMTGRSKKLESSLELISYTAFNEGIRQSVMGEDFTHWLPLYISKDHAQRASAKDLYRLAISSICGVDVSQFSPQMAVEVLTSLMNTMVVNVMQGKVYGISSNRCIH
jgi:ubiquitin-protein ligase